MEGFKTGKVTEPGAGVWAETETEAYRDGPWLQSFLFRAMSWLMILVFGLFALAFDVMLGHAGVMSLGHSAFLGVSAYATGLLLARFQAPVEVSLLAGAAAGLLTALLVGGLGIANVMLMAVLERRNEIGLRRALGATRGHIVGQFLTEAILLAGAGGIVGAVLGSAVAAAYATSQAWVVALPIAGCVVGVLGAAAVGGIAGLYPAIRAANLAPTDSLRA